jgi:hypothetical protein
MKSKEKVLLDAKYLNTDILELFIDLYTKNKLFIQDNPDCTIEYIINTNKDNSVLHIKTIQHIDDTITSEGRN